MHKSKSRRIILNFDRPIDNEKISIVYYSKSNRNLFSLPSLTRVKRRFRRTIIPTDVQSQTCAKHEYEIDFNQFSFGQWILQPKTFNAYICAGTCPNPLSSRYFPSNHAILLSLIRSQQSQGQEPSCVPVKFKPLCLLYYEKDELVIKYHRDMIVEECGCRWSMFSTLLHIILFQQRFANKFQLQVHVKHIFCFISINESKQWRMQLRLMKIEADKSLKLLLQLGYQKVWHDTNNLFESYITFVFKRDIIMRSKVVHYYHMLEIRHLGAMSRIAWRNTEPPQSVYM